MIGGQLPFGNEYAYEEKYSPKRIIFLGSKSWTNPFIDFESSVNFIRVKRSLGQNLIFETSIQFFMGKTSL